MFKNVKESLVEVVIGDAILELLEADAPISHDVLLARLTQHLEQETRETRREALQAAIEEVRSSHSLSERKGEDAAQWRTERFKLPEDRLLQLNSDPPGRDDKRH